MVFSVIIPFHNEERYIGHCAQALQKQDFDKDEYELIFVDNGSSDRSCDIVTSFPKTIVLKEETEKCGYTARNKGLQVAKGDIIAFTDGDCAVYENWLTSIYEEMKNTKAGILVGPCYFPSRSSRLVRFFEDYENTKIDYVFSHCDKSRFFAYGRNMAVKADIFKKTGLFAATPFVGDLELIQRCVSRYPEIKVGYLPNMRITHLEVTRLMSWLKKIFIYGQHSRYKSVECYTPLDYKTKLRIFSLCRRKYNYTLTQSMLSLSVFVLGDLIYKAGRCTGLIRYLILNKT